MQIAESIIATTHTDSQGDKLTKEALDNLVQSIKNHYIPINNEHDPRLPPIGRISSGFTRQRSDGEFEAVAILELFDNTDSIKLNSDGREMIIESTEGISISYDWTHRFDEDQTDITSIASILKTDALYSIKKSSDPISIITISAGVFVVGGIASGFLKEIGSDGWKKIKPILGKLFSRKTRTTNDQLLKFSVCVQHNDNIIEIDIIQTNPNEAEISNFIDNGFKKLDEVLPFYCANQNDIKKLVFSAKGNNLEINFAVRKDCQPLKSNISVSDFLSKNTPKRDGF